MKIFVPKQCLLLFILFISSLSLVAEVGVGTPSSLIFNLDACTSYNYNGTDVDYSEFTADISNGSDVSLSVLGNSVYRLNPQMNKHSCTPGLNDTEAMCISYDPICDYQPGSQRSLKFDVQVSPLTSSPAQLQQLSFYEKSPLMFDWIDGPEGLNNFPTQYGLRVLKNGEVIFEQGMNATTTEWSLTTLHNWATTLGVNRSF